MLVYRRTQPLGEGWALARQLAAPADPHKNQGYPHADKGSGQGLDQGMNDDVDVDGVGGVMMGLERKSNKSMREPLKKLIQEVGSCHCPDHYVM